MKWKAYSILTTHCIECGAVIETSDGSWPPLRCGCCVARKAKVLPS